MQLRAEGEGGGGGGGLNTIIGSIVQAGPAAPGPSSAQLATYPLSVLVRLSVAWSLPWPAAQLWQGLQ